MSFYGNITNTAKTTFSFDHIYTTRVEMDKYANTDGVFLGRYVLVNYDEPPIQGYFDGKDFYNGQSYIEAIKITPRENVVYQDLNYTPDKPYRFYTWSKDRARYEGLSIQSSYAKYFAEDVAQYGRGYDSTVWVKRYDNSGSYKYTLIAELNAVVPTFHLVVDKPSEVPITPFFDRDTTNIDYYLHMQSNYGMQIKAAEKEEYSDETIMRTPVYWDLDSSGKPAIRQEQAQPIAADIYYNNKGFDYKIRTFIDPNETDYGKNTINYNMIESGRLYGSEAIQGVYEEGHPANDVYQWYIRLAGIGNAISNMWDKVYGEVDNGQTRYLNHALKREDSKDHLVTYDKNTLIGMINTTQDLLGYHFVPFDNNHYYNSDTEYSEIKNNNSKLKITLTYDNDIAQDEIEYYALDCLFYDKDATTENVNIYYHYAYAPEYTPVTGPIDLNSSETYYYKDEKNVFHIANKANQNAKDANGNSIDPLYEIYYTATPRWIMKPLVIENHDTVYGLLNQIHKLLGTNAEDIRDFTTLQGTINIIKDIIDRVNLNLSPGKLLHTNNNGVIETTETFFPSADWDKDKVLDGDGNWVSRFATVKVLTNSENANQVALEVNTIVDGIEQNVAKTIVSDNDKVNDGTSLVNSKKHTTNNLTLGTRNKWIQLYGNEDKDSIEFKHLESPIIGRLLSEQAEGSKYLDMHKDFDDNGNVILQDLTQFGNFSTNTDATEIKVEPTTDTLSYIKGTKDQDDNRLTIPYIVTDNAGHIVELGTKNFNVPHTFKYLTISDDNTDDIVNGTRATPGTLEADQLTDTWTMAPQNKWIDISRDSDDGITIGHKYSELPKHDFMDDIDIDNNIDGSKTTDCSFEFPMPITDNAGHIVDYTTKKIYIPYNYRTIALLTQSSSEDSITVSDGTQTADSTIDTFTFATGNQWIEASIGDDQLTFAHAVIDKNATINWKFEASAKETNAGVTTSNWEKAKADGNELTIPSFTIDNAGHVIGNDVTKFYIPNNFRNITVADATGIDVNATQNSDTLEADSTVDGWTIASQNQWLKIAANPETDLITIGHSYSPQTKHDFTDDVDIVSALNGTKQTDNAFTFPTVVTDNAGHIVGYNTSTVYIPHTFKTIRVTEQSTANTAVVPSSTEEDISAENIIDVFTIATGNKWVQTTSDTANDRVTFSHALSGVTLNTNDNLGEYGVIDQTNLEPQFGSSFSVPGYKVDAAGHIVTSGAHMVKIPTISYSESGGTENANSTVLTSIGLIPETGTLTGTKVDIGNLRLVNYQTEMDEQNPNAISTNETLAEVIKKLEKSIILESQTRETSINNLKLFSTITVKNNLDDAGININAFNNNDNLIFQSSEGIVLEGISNEETQNNIIQIKHAGSYEEKEKDLYSIKIDNKGHTTEATPITQDDLVNKYQIATQAMIDDIITNYGLVLNAPVILSTNKIQTETGVELNIQIQVTENDIYKSIWFNADDNTNLTEELEMIEGITTYEALTAGNYKCIITRIHNNQTSTTTSETFVITEADLPTTSENPEGGDPIDPGTEEEIPTEPNTGI